MCIYKRMYMQNTHRFSFVKFSHICTFVNYVLVYICVLLWLFVCKIYICKHYKYEKLTTLSHV